MWGYLTMWAGSKSVDAYELFEDFISRVACFNTCIAGSFIILL